MIIPNAAQSCKQISFLTQRRKERKVN